jgi:hypothetical protein
VTVEIRFGGIVLITRPSYHPRDKTIGSNFIPERNILVYFESSKVKCPNVYKGEEHVTPPFDTLRLGLPEPLFKFRSSL